MRIRSSPGAASTATVESTSDSIAHALGLGIGDDADEQDAHGKQMTEKERAIVRNLIGLRNRLRELLFIEHSALFFSGNAYFK